MAAAAPPNGWRSVVFSRLRDRYQLSSLGALAKQLESSDLRERQAVLQMLDTDQVLRATVLVIVAAVAAAGERHEGHLSLEQEAQRSRLTPRRQDRNR